MIGPFRLACLAPCVLACWYDDLVEIGSTTNSSDFHAIIGPLAALVNQTYTSSAGCTYYDPAHARWLPEGYRLSTKDDPATGGMRAFFFERGDPSDADYRAVVAFRGTDLGTSHSVFFAPL